MALLEAAMDLVNDYLSSRKDFTNPLGDNEFRI